MQETIASWHPAPMADDELRALRARLELNSRIDDLVEQAMRQRLGLAETMARILPALCEATGARGAFIHTFNEELVLSLHRHPKDLRVPGLDHILDSTSAHDSPAMVNELPLEYVFSRPLDVAGEWFGCAGMIVPKQGMSSSLDQLACLLSVACEEVDNFLFSIRAAREKHRVIMSISDALRHRVLDEGLHQAVKALGAGVPFDRLLLVCATEEHEHKTLHVQLYHEDHCELDTMGGAATPDHERLRSAAQTLLHSDNRYLLDQLGFVGELEQVLINGIVDATIVGKVFVTPRSGTFNTHDRDLLDGFAGFVRQRVIDFNKEWRTLSASFPAEDVTRLLFEDHYAERFLAPREAEVAMMYADISGFTRLSEQVLRTPSAVGQLVEAWSRQAVSLVWKHRGVFDKMVGDCIIALFGPPFYEQPPELRLEQAIRCALAIRTMTSELPEQPAFEHLRGVVLGVSCGVNLAPLFVGRFGPNDNFTGFSAGMNNTARLQGCADRDEVLVMSDALERLPANHRFRLGPERTARVKNVAAPIRFRSVD